MVEMWYFPVGGGILPAVICEWRLRHCQRSRQAGVEELALTKPGGRVR